MPEKINLLGPTLCKMVLIGSLTGAMGCATALPICEKASPVNYVRIDFAAEAELLTDSSASIRQTPGYLKALSEIQTVAIRAPNECLDVTAGRAEGRGDGEVVLKTNCAIYLSELEKNSIVFPGICRRLWIMHRTGERPANPV